MEREGHQMAGALVPLTLQWSLNETADGCYKISKHIVHAATTDNVQTIVLDALDKFGATLAVCSETEYHVEQQLRHARGSRAVEFLKARIGFSTGDSCEALSKSTGGVRFLSLAATLATIESQDAAKATRKMMEDSSRTNQILPTLGQLRDIYASLEYKTHRLGFAERIMQWQSKCAEYRRVRRVTRSPLSDPRSITSEYDEAYPQQEVIPVLVSALRQVHRLGQGSFVRITGAHGFGWLIAFCEWCVGIPPKVIYKSYDNIVQDDIGGKSKVLILLTEPMKTTIEISTHIDSPTSLLEINMPVRCETWSGMVPIASFGKRFIQACGINTDLESRALDQALVHSTAAVIPHLPLLRKSARNQGKGSKTSLSHLDAGLGNFSERVASAISEYLGADSRQAYRLREMAEGQEIRNLPIVAQHIKALKEEECQCRYCGNNPSSTNSCLIQEFEYYVAHVTAQILALSLFELIEPVKLFSSISSLPSQVVKQSGRLIIKVIKILFPGSEVGSKLLQVRSLWYDMESIGHPTITLYDLFGLGLHLIGHKASSQDRWIASAHRGQAVFAYFFESRQLEPRSMTLIDGGPGTILYNDERYSLVQGGDELSPPNSRLDYSGKPKVDRLRNLLDPKDMKIVWEVTPHADHLSLQCGSSGTQLSQRRDPTTALRRATECHFASSCLHDPLAVLERPDTDAFYDISISSQKHHLKNGVIVIAVHGNDDMRFLALTGIGDSVGVIRQNACLQCCLDICRCEGLNFVLC